MSQQNQRPELFYPHKKAYLLEISEKVSFCNKCSSALVTDKFGKTKTTIKPLNYHTKWENVSFSFIWQSNANKKYNFANYRGFMEIRTYFVKIIKKKCENLKLNLKTYFLAIDYFTQICSLFDAFSTENLIQIADICIILAAKTSETKKKSIKAKSVLCQNISPDIYIRDEQYILAKLNFDLIRITSYDILMDIIKCGFVFNDEQFNYNILNSIYKQIENMLYLFSETKHYIKMTPNEIAIGLMGLAREILGLNAFSENIQLVFMNLNECDDIHICNYLKCLNKIRKCFKIQRSNVRDSNSDNRA